MMKTLSLLAVGAVALAGCDFAGSADAVTAPSSAIEATNLSGAEGQTDLYIDVQDATGRSYYRSAPELVAADGMVTLALPAGFSIPGSTARMHIAVYDYGTSYNDSRLLARSSAFTAADLVASGTMALVDDHARRPFYGHAGSDARFSIWTVQP